MKGNIYTDFGLSYQVSELKYCTYLDHNFLSMYLLWTLFQKLCKFPQPQDLQLYRPLFYIFKKYCLN